MGWLTANLQWFWETFSWAGVVGVAIITWFMITLGLYILSARAVRRASLIAGGLLVIVISLTHPQILDDRNLFLAEFVTRDLLSVLGIIVTITLASAASLHLEFNKIEERYQKRGLTNTRIAVKRTAFGLIVMFLGAILLAVIKPLIATEAWMQALVNGAAIMIVFCNILALITLTQIVFQIEPRIDNE